ncbi:hypothetical protein SSX86_019948 [Deinandra increscens subsp. villosa]|uniref:VQ domain-containing protein n=1 Tax=Deinandra increscens subsp. villosa TaxID=3103831 RepID=A0AAP0GTI3_9ASTR
MSPARLHAKEEHEDDQKPLKFTGSFTTTPTVDATKTQPPPPPPVIIYTHSPKVIHTHPRDFRSLVQKLTGYTPPMEETRPAQDPRQVQDQGNMEDNESSSVVTDEHCSSVNDVPQVNSCLTDGGFDPYFNPTPFFPANPGNYLCTPTHQLPFYAPDSRLFNRNALSSSSSSLRVLREYQDI